jgi:hypothetical protein
MPSAFSYFDRNPQYDTFVLAGRFERAPSEAPATKGNDRTRADGQKAEGQQPGEEACRTALPARVIDDDPASDGHACLVEGGPVPRTSDAMRRKHAAVVCDSDVAGRIRVSAREPEEERPDETARGESGESGESGSASPCRRAPSSSTPCRPSHFGLSGLAEECSAGRFTSDSSFLSDHERAMGLRSKMSRGGPSRRGGGSARPAPARS